MERFYIILAIPFFISLMALEAWVANRQKIKAYKASDTIANIGCGIGQQVLDLFFVILLIPGYIFIQTSFSPVKLEPSWINAVLLFLLIDLVYYLYHRLSHAVPLLWAVHSVHHQSEEFNFSVGLRQAWFHKIVSFPIYIPPAILGFDAKLYLTVASIHAVAQIWTHTQIINSRKWPIRYIFVTPSHHRVHHGRDSIYLNKNFGGIISVWDYLFKSFQAEQQTPDYGTLDGNPDNNAWLAQWRGLKTLLFASPLSKNTKIHNEKFSWKDLIKLTIALVGYIAFTMYFPDLGWIAKILSALFILSLLALDVRTFRDQS